jgi:hypothetical protein
MSTECRRIMHRRDQIENLFTRSWPVTRPTRSPREGLRSPCRINKIERKRLVPRMLLMRPTDESSVHGRFPRTRGALRAGFPRAAACKAVGSNPAGGTTTFPSSEAILSLRLQPSCDLCAIFSRL